MVKHLTDHLMANWTSSSETYFCFISQLPLHLLLGKLSILELSMYPNKVMFSGPLNRLNTCYASLDIVDSINNLKNYDFLVPSGFHPPITPGTQG